MVRQHPISHVRGEPGARSARRARDRASNDHCPWGYREIASGRQPLDTPDAALSGPARIDAGQPEGIGASGLWTPGIVRTAVTTIAPPLFAEGGPKWSSSVSRITGKAQVRRHIGLLRTTTDICGKPVDSTYGSEGWGPPALRVARPPLVTAPYVPSGCARGPLRSRNRPPALGNPSVTGSDPLKCRNALFLVEYLNREEKPPHGDEQEARLRQVTPVRTADESAAAARCISGSEVVQAERLDHPKAQ